MFACMYVCVCPMRPEEGVRFPRTCVTDSYELQCGCWVLNPGPLQKQSVILIVELTVELPLQPQE